MKKNKTPTKKTFIIFSVILFLIILIAGSAGFIFSMRQVVRTNKSNELTQLLETERIRLEATLNSEIAIVLKLADSPVVKRHIINPGNPEQERIAAEEIASYRQAFSGFSIFWMNDHDRLFHSDDNEPYWVDADDPVNYWYSMTLYDTEVYNFNINYNPDIDQIKLWINAPIRDDNGKPAGMVGTGIELSEFIDKIFSGVDERTELYFFIEDGKIYAAKDVQDIIDDANITDVMSGFGIDIFAEIKNLKTNALENRIFDVANGVAAVGYIPSLNWYYASKISFDLADYDVALIVLFLVALVLIMAIIIIFNLIVSGFLKSLRNAAEEIASVTRKRERELVADNEILDRMNRMKNEFFRDMSHDLKTPLTVISTSVLNADDMLDFGVDKGVLRESLRTAQNEIMRMARMVDSTMKYSSLHDNRRDMHPLDIAPLLRDGAETHRALLARNDNELILDVPERLPHIRGNGDMLLHVLSNLLSNANRHTRSGSILVKATLDGDTITVTARDSGAGVNPEIMPRIFERGVSEGGTGLGLAICKTAIEAHNGTIKVESERDKGAAVIFTLPVYKSD